MSDEPTIRAEPPIDGGAAHPPYSQDVEVLALGGRRIVLVGTAHISQESVDLVRLVIERERPDVVCVELDQRRFEALSSKRRWESLDLREIIRKRQIATLLLNLMLASYQKRLGGKLGVVPGSELLAAIELAKALDIPVELCDRDVRITLRRAWSSLSFGRKAMLLSGVIAGAGTSPEISEEDIRKLRRKDALSEVMEEFGRALPELKRALIDERDSYLATKIQNAPGAAIVAVVGAGHVAGMARALTEGRRADLAELETIPEVSSSWVMASWAVTLSVVLAIVYIGATEGVKAASSNALIWGVAHSIPSALGGILAFGHPLTVLSAFVSAPFTALSPLIGVGHVTAFVQAYLVPPRVTEFQSVGDEMAQPLAWWRNRLLRVFLVFILTSLGGVLGTWVAGAKILANVFK
jgi:pheromone shutdown-related protein TraB